MWTYNAKVIRVVDGDSIIVDIDLGFSLWLRNQSIRLAGIDAPEIRTNNTLEKSAGLLSKSRVEELVSNKNITITTVLDKTEKFGRILGTIYTENGININETLLNERLAVPYNGQSKELVLKEQSENIKFLISSGLIK